ncbi:MAG: hypothetical protein ACEQSX_04295, partial [Baekduiaceae bacterium]
TGCAVNPATGKHEFTLVTPTQVLKPRLRFDLETAMACYASRASQAPDVPVNREDRAPSRGRQTRRLPIGLPEPGSVLAVRPLGEGADRAA